MLNCVVRCVSWATRARSLSAERANSISICKLARNSSSVSVFLLSSFRWRSAAYITARLRSSSVAENRSNIHMWSRKAGIAFGSDGSWIVTTSGHLLRTSMHSSGLSSTKMKLFKARPRSSDSACKFSDFEFQLICHAAQCSARRTQDSDSSALMTSDSLFLLTSASNTPFSR